MRISGETIYLTPFTEKNFNDDYIGWLGDIEVIRYLGREEYFSPTPKNEIYQYVEDMWNSDFIEFYAIYTVSNKFIGTTKINFVNEQGLKNKICDIGIMIGDKSSWGKGFASEVIHVISKFAFSSLNVNKLTAGAISPNIGVIKAFLKNGYKEEGRLRKCVNVQNELMDHVLLGCFKDELKVHNRC
jgi:RimJ/RimL family protein N-acetyltransferase